MPSAAPVVAMPSDSVNNCRSCAAVGSEGGTNSESCCRLRASRQQQNGDVRAANHSSDATAPNSKYNVGPSGRAYTSTMLRSLTLTCPDIAWAPAWRTFDDGLQLALACSRSHLAGA